MKKLINYIYHLGIRNSTFFLIFILVLNLIFNLLVRYNHLIPYGFDEIITIWPVGNELNNSKLIHWTDILFSRFLSEDHIFAVTNFFAYLICKLNGNIIENLYWISRLSYLIILCLSIILIKDLGFTKSNIIYFVIIFLNAGPINFGILSYNFNFNLVCIFSLLTLIFYLKPQKIANTLLFLLFCFLGTFTSENFYIIYPTILFIFCIKKTKKGNSRSWFVIIYFLVILIFKFWLSFKYLGLIMPTSRLNLSGNGIFFNALSVVFQLFNGIIFGLPLFFVQSKKIWALIILITFSIFIIIYIISLIFSNIFNNDKSHLFYFLIFFGLFSINFIIDPYSKLKFFNNESSESSNLAYTLIEKQSDKIVIYNLNVSTPPMHPIAFWIGSKIYNKQQGLIFKKNERSFHMYNIDIESINIDTDESLRKIKVSSNKNVTTLVNSKNAFIKMNYLDRLTSEYAISENYKKNIYQEYDIINPLFHQNNIDTFTVNIFSNDLISIIPEIKLNKSKVLNLKKNKNSIKFDFVSASIKDQLILNQINFKIKNIFITCQNQNKQNFVLNDGLQIISDKNSFYKLSNSNFEIYGTINPPNIKYLENVISTKTLTKMNIQFWYYDPSINKWNPFTLNNEIVNPNSVLFFKNNRIFIKKRS